jgi:hypothetical protein
MPSGWLIAVAGIFAFVVLTIWLNLRIRSRQQLVARSRPSITAEEFVRQLATADVSPHVSSAVHLELSSYCARDVTLHPDDPLEQFLEIDLDELEFVLSRLLKQLKLPLPPIEQSRTWDPRTPRDIALLLDAWRERQDGIAQ